MGVDYYAISIIGYKILRKHLSTTTTITKIQNTPCNCVEQQDHVYCSTCGQKQQQIIQQKDTFIKHDLSAYKIYPEYNEEHSGEDSYICLTMTRTSENKSKCIDLDLLKNKKLELQKIISNNGLKWHEENFGIHTILDVSC